MASKLEKARTQIIVNHPFFASIMMKKPMKLDPSIPTACINPYGYIRISPDFIENLSVDQVVFLIAHECMHWMQDTFGRQGSRDMKGWNIATDAVNNELLVESGVGTFIEGGVRWPGAENMTAEEVYDQLKSGKQPSGASGMGDPGDEDGQSPGGPGSDLDPRGKDGQQMSEGERQALSSEIKVDIAAAKEIAKQMGKMPGGLSRFVDNLIHVPTPWYQILEKYVTERIRTDYTWTRPNRRFAGLGMYLPSIDGMGMGTIPIIVDTSGSVSTQELTAFASHVSAIMETCQPKAVHVIYVDSGVSRVDVYEPHELPLKLDPAGGGGTDMRVGVEWAEKNLPDSPVMIMLTDGYTPWPERTSIPMITVTSGQEAPIGESIKIEV